MSRRSAWRRNRDEILIRLGASSCHVCDRLIHRRHVSTSGYVFETMLQTLAMENSLYKTQ